MTKLKENFNEGWINKRKSEYMGRHTTISGLKDLILKTCQLSSKLIYNFTVMPMKIPAGFSPQNLKNEFQSLCHKGKYLRTNINSCSIQKWKGASESYVILTWEQTNDARD